jgi:hypothetical protein
MCDEIERAMGKTVCRMKPKFSEWRNICIPLKTAVTPEAGAFAGVQYRQREAGM